MIHLHIEEAYDHVRWFFVPQLMTVMGFGERMSQLSLMLGLGGVIGDIPLTRSLR